MLLYAMRIPHSLVILSILYFPLLWALPMEFVYNGFNDSNKLKLSGNAAILPSGILQLTDNKEYVLGHAFHPSPLHLQPNSTFSFSTAFIFSIAPVYGDLAASGLAFVITPFPDLPGAQVQEYLGLPNASTTGKYSNRFFAVEFDTVKTDSLEDKDDNHVGIDLNTLVSNASARPELNLKSGKNIQAWIDYTGSNHNITVRVALAGSGRPLRPLLSFVADLQNELLRDSRIYVGFSASTGLVSNAHSVKGWSFTTNGTAADLNLPQIQRANHLAIIIPSLVLTGIFSATLLILLLRRVYNSLPLYYKFLLCIYQKEHVEDLELGCGPRRFTYLELRVATEGFKDLLGSGGFGQVYRGVVSGGQEVAVKRMSHDSRQGELEFAAEISSMGRMRHRNLVQLRGFCRRKRELFLVYDYMPNGSLDRRLFERGPGLSWERRFRILKDVAAALLYLHEEWEQQVVHRDVKASNVLLDGKFNARLSDFGLARLCDHGKNPQTTKVVGTLGYVAPELTRTGKAAPSSDVFSYGALLLEVACGRPPVEPRRCEEEMVLVEWVWGFEEQGKILQAADRRLLLGGAYVAEEVEMVMKLGLLCSHAVYERRPTMRQIVQILSGVIPLPVLPAQMPVLEHRCPPPVILLQLGHDDQI